MSVKKPIGAGLLVVVAFVVMALAAPLASATRISPASTAIKGTLTANNETTPRTVAEFLPSNAYATTSIQCKESEVTGTTPSQVSPTAGTLNNTNRKLVGEFSNGPGGVFMDIANPTFSKCGVYQRVSGAWAEVEGAEVKTNSTSGKWTLSGDFISSTAIPVAIGVPPNGAKLFITSEKEAGCTITVSNERASAAMGRWTNGENSTTKPSLLRVDSQLSFSQTAGCPAATSPAQEEASYNVIVAAGGTVPVKIEE